MDRFLSIFALILCLACVQEEIPVNKRLIEEQVELNRNLEGRRNTRILDRSLDFGCENRFDLIAGQTIEIGVIDIGFTDSEVNVTFATDDGWRLAQTHLYIGTEADLPLNNGGNPKIGQFTFQSDHEPPTNSFTYTISKEELTFETSEECDFGIVIAAHAATFLKDESGEVIQEETAWGRGNVEFPGNRWGWYFRGCLSDLAPSIELTGGGAICEGDTTTLTFIFTGRAPFNFTYTDQEGNIIDVETSESIYELEVSQAGTYSVVSFADASGCAGSDPEESVMVTDNPLPEVISITGDSTVCFSDGDPDNDQVEITLKFSGTAPFEGDINGEPFLSESDTFIYSVGPGNYTVGALVDANGCSATQLGDGFTISEECEDVDPGDDDEADEDEEGNEDDGEDTGENDGCDRDHDYYNDYCRVHANAFAFGAYEASCFPRYGFKRWGWTNKVYEGSYTFDIYASVGSCNPDWGTVVGTLDVDYYEGTATITYNLDHPESAWSSLNAYIGYTPLPLYHGFPTIAPRKYPHHSDGCRITSFSCPGLDGGPIYIIAHSEVILD